MRIGLSWVHPEPIANAHSFMPPNFAVEVASEQKPIFDFDRHVAALNAQIAY
jgi:hypothetical protein